MSNVTALLLTFYSQPIAGAQAQLEQAMTAAPGHVNELVEQIMERLHSAVLEGPSGDGDVSPTLTEVLLVSGSQA